MEDLTICEECDWEGESADTAVDIDGNIVCPDCGAVMDQGDQDEDTV